MRRSLIALILLAWPSAAPSRSADPAPSEGRRALQAAVDALPSTGGVVALPAGAVDVDGPVYLDRGGVELAGAGRFATEIRARHPYEGPPLVVGLSRAPPLTRADRPPSANLLDGTAGQRFGLTLGPGEHVAFAATDLDSPPAGGWPAIRALCLEWAVRAPAGTTALPPGAMFGLSDRTRASPWFVYGAPPGRVLFQFRAGAEADADRGFWCDVPFAPPESGVWRFCLQVDLVARKATAYAQGVQVAVGTVPRTWDAAPAAFRPNDFACFQVGGSGSGVVVPTEAFQSPPPGVTWLYLRVGRQWRYADDGAGKPQRPLPGVAAGDAAGFQVGPDLIGCLTLADPNLSREVVLGTPRYTRTVGFQAGPAAAGPLAWTGPFALRDLRLRGAAGALIGPALHLDAQRVDFAGRSFGVRTLGGKVTYAHYFAGCDFAGDDAGVLAGDAILGLRDARFLRSGRHTIRTRRTDLAVDGLFVAGFGRCEAVVSHRGGPLLARRINADFEDGVNPSVALVDHEAIGAGDNLPDTCEVGSLTGGAMPPGVPLVRLRGPGPATVTLTNLWAATRSAPPVRCEGPRWSGTLDGRAIGMAPVPPAAGAK